MVGRSCCRQRVRYDRKASIVRPIEFSALVDDRRGDIFVLQGKNTDAKTAYLKAYTAFESQSEYRRLVGIKLSALGVKLESTDKSVAATGVSK